ncbi:MAG: endonuclease III domain-containing protein, partial [Thermodesulfobacteriota bacterium]|nr:endonuclease III domain-containing protein [Thermodesulfobacteriota bacterium]
MAIILTDSFDPLDLYHVLFKAYGPSLWWPGDSPFEIMLGAVLTQNTAWTNVEKAIENLRTHDMLGLDAIHHADLDDLAALIRPSGYYNIKAGRIRNLTQKIVQVSQGRLDEFFSMDLDMLRSTLLDVKGVGKETADSICCYAADKQIFVIDAYTRRILERHKVIDASWGYDDIRQLFEQGLPRDLGVYKDLHAYMVFLGKDYCRKKMPCCDGCPLEIDIAAVTAS